MQEGEAAKMIQTQNKDDKAADKKHVRLTAMFEASAEVPRLAGKHLSCICLDCCKLFLVL